MSDSTAKHFNLGYNAGYIDAYREVCGVLNTESQSDHQMCDAIAGLVADLPGLRAPDKHSDTLGGCAVFAEDVSGEVCKCGRARAAHTSRVLPAGSIVNVAGGEMTVIRYVENDDVYLLETRDGFNTRRYYRADLILSRNEMIS